MVPEVSNRRDLKLRWEYLHGKKSSILSLAEEYAEWTLPYVFPRMGDNSNTELQLAKDSIGSQAVNHLANKVVSVLYPGQRMFFRLHVSAEMKQLLKAALAQANQSTSVDTAAALAKAMTVVETQLAETEQRASEYMDMVTYRPQAVNSAKLLIITGNALMFHPPGKPVQVYNLRDYCVVRDLSGEVIEIMTKESKAFETFHPDVQAQLKALNVPGSHKKDYDAKTEVTIYSRIILEADGKFHLYQSGDYIDLDTDGAVWTKNDLIWVPLTWNLVRGEDYGRGLVADYSGAFHAVNILTGALLNIAAIIGDIKFLVNPASVVDVTEMNAAKPGSYHSGKEGDITTVKIEKTMDAQFIGTMIERYEKQIAQAFLLGSQLTRNAERVTAEEIRASANELETSNGGIYSRLAATWQVQTANIVLAQINFVGVQNGIKPQIITGLDSLSRAGELDNIRLWLGDMALLNGVPEDVREWLKVGEFMEVIGTNRQVEYKRFTMTEAEHDEVVRRRREAEAAAMQAEQAAKGQGAVQAAAMKQG